MRLLTLVLDDFQDIELTTVLGTLEKAKTFSQFDYYNTKNKNEVLGQHHVTWIKINVKEVNVNDYEAIFIPGGRAAKFLRNDKKALQLIQDFATKNKKIFAICDAPNALFENGIIKQQKFASYPLNKKQYNEQNVADKTIVDGNFITSKCPFTSFDLALEIIKYYQGENIAAEIEKSLKGEF